jgi:hypothetical protein
MRLRWVAAISLAFTYLFFFEYLPPFRWVEIPYDLRGYHYPLDEFAFQKLRHGQIPQWDPTMYCGMTFVGNPQTALFYPPMWMVFAANHGNARLKYRSLQIMQIAHVWLAFVFCFMWLRNRKLHDFAALFGAGIFAYGGTMLMQLSHLGMLCAVAWMPLALWGIDRLRKAWDGWAFAALACSSALSLLAGHPPTWFVVATCILVYAAFSSGRTFLIAAAGIAGSLMIAAVQLFPSMEAARLKEPHEQYGAGIRELAFYISYFVPNFYDFGIATDAFTNPGYEYLYVGAPALFGLACVLIRPRVLKQAIPVLAVAAASAILVTNPFGLVWAVIRHSAMLEQICRSWNFLAGIGIAIAGLAAYGLDAFLRAQPMLWRRWWLPLVIGSAALWSAHLLRSWRPGGSGFAIGWKAAIEPGVMLALFSLMMLGWIAERSRRRAWLALAFIVATGIDYKVFGTSKRFDALRANSDRFLAAASFPGMSESVYQQLREAQDYRIGLDSADPSPADLRRLGLRTPQGGDTLVPEQYNKILRPEGTYYDFVGLDPANRELVQLLGVRYFITSEGQPLFPKLVADPEFRLLDKDQYFQVFEYARARPAYRWERPGPRDAIVPGEWSAEDREFDVTSESGGRFILVEEMYPGWRAFIDGRPVPDERWHDVFQSVAVPAGKHRVRFQFHSMTFRIGAIVSCISILGLALMVMRRARLPLQDQRRSVGLALPPALL